MSDHIKQTLARLADALRQRPEVGSAALYGSYVRGEHRESSDIDLAVVVRADDLAALATPLRDAWRAARVDPWIAREDELAGLCDAFATRVRDIQRRHEMLVGEDPWGALVVPRGALRLRVEQELRNHQIRLRRAEVLGDAEAQARQLALAAGALRHDLALLEELAGGDASDRAEAVADAAAARLDLARDDVRAVLAFRARADGDVLARAKVVIDRAVAFVDRMEVT